MKFHKEFDVIYYMQPRKTDPVTESHRYKEGWSLTERYCSQCGKRGTWISDSEDYEAGPSLFCAECGYTHTINYERMVTEHLELVNDQDWQRLQALRS
jgi:hypothetical protein